MPAAPVRRFVHLLLIRELVLLEEHHFSKYSSAQIERTARMRQFVELVKEENGTISEALEADFQDTRMYVSPPLLLTLLSLFRASFFVLRTLNQL